MLDDPSVLSDIAVSRYYRASHWHGHIQSGQDPGIQPHRCVWVGVVCVHVLDKQSWDAAELSDVE